MANNLRKFATESEYNSATLNYPSVSWITSTDTVHFDKVSPIPPKKLKLTYSDSSTYDIVCDTATTLTSSDVEGGTSEKSEITSAEIGNCVTSIGSNVFQGCSGLTSCTIGSGVTSIGNNAFVSCYSLASIDIPNSVTSIGSGAFYNCRSLTSIDIPNGVTTIYGSAFYGCSGLTSVTIGSGVTTIYGSAFKYCTSLTSIDIPDSVIAINSEIFADCSSLTSCTIGSGVTEINAYVFENCVNLSSVTITAIAPPRLGSGVFNNTLIASGSGYIYVPSQSLEAYKTAWSNYASRIQAIIE